ncbi:homeobox protein 9-like [Microplitis mediator]|uniref:homeobox protein 9-like n=1 Tax=Microplitis mediator TaxID=375433 RepID=UPI00255775E4|nr:homeobox protein 9-like [Microplitis mediator]
MMMITEDVVSFQKGLMDWLTEESEYVLQRLDRWTSIARGYNRLYPQRLSRGCMTMQKEPDDESWRHSPSFHTLTGSSSRRVTRIPDEVRKINCCGTFNYQSNSRVDNSCLEAYRYDHSIYFKTIGDIKSSKNIKETENHECKEETLDCSDDQDLNDVSGDETLNDEIMNDLNDVESPMDEDSISNNEITWFDKNYCEVLNQEFSRNCCIDQTTDTFIDHKYDCLNNNNNNNNDNNNNNNEVQCQNLNNNSSSSTNLSTEIMNTNQMTSVEEKNQDNGVTRILSFGKSNRRTKNIKQSKVLGDNNISWPGVLFSYNVDSSLASSHHRVLNVK